jgi:hypothetical protein
MSEGRAEDNVTPLNPDRAADAADPANKVTPIHPGAARSAEEEIPKIDGDLHKQLKEALEQRHRLGDHVDNDSFSNAQSQSQ